MTQLECAQYAHQRSFGFGTTPETTTSVPNGCYQTSDKVLYFNASGGTADCSNDHKCICAPFVNTWYVSTVSTGVTPFYMTEIDAGACSDVIGRSELSELECSDGIKTFVENYAAVVKTTSAVSHGCVKFKDSSTGTNEHSSFNTERTTIS